MLNSHLAMVCVDFAVAVVHFKYRYVLLLLFSSLFFTFVFVVVFFFKLKNILYEEASNVVKFKYLTKPWIWQTTFVTGPHT